jgi:hypothetical protein
MPAKPRLLATLNEKRMAQLSPSLKVLIWAWLDKLATTPSAVSTYRVAHYLLYEHWRHHGKPFSLPNGMLRIGGVTRIFETQRRAQSSPNAHQGKNQTITIVQAQIDLRIVAKIVGQVATILTATESAAPS